MDNNPPPKPPPPPAVSPTPSADKRTRKRTARGGDKKSGSPATSSSANRTAAPSNGTGSPTSTGVEQTTVASPSSITMRQEPVFSDRVVTPTSSPSRSPLQKRSREEVSVALKAQIADGKSSSSATMSPETSMASTSSTNGVSMRTKSHLDGRRGGVRTTGDEKDAKTLKDPPGKQQLSSERDRLTDPPAKDTPSSSSHNRMEKVDGDRKKSTNKDSNKGSEEDPSIVRAPSSARSATRTARTLSDATQRTSTRSPNTQPVETVAPKAPSTNPLAKITKPPLSSTRGAPPAPKPRTKLPTESERVRPSALLPARSSSINSLCTAQLPAGSMRNIELSDENIALLQTVLQEPSKPREETINPAVQQQMDDDDADREARLQAKIDDFDEREEEENEKDWEGVDKGAWLAKKWPALAHLATVPAATIPPAASQELATVPATAAPTTTTGATVAGEQTEAAKSEAAKAEAAKAEAAKRPADNFAPPSLRSFATQTKQVVTNCAGAQTDTQLNAPEQEPAAVRAALQRLQKELKMREDRMAAQVLKVGEKRDENERLQKEISDFTKSNSALLETINAMKETENRQKEQIKALQANATRNDGVISALEASEKLHMANYERMRKSCAASAEKANEMKKKLDDAKQLERALFKREEKNVLWRTIRSELGAPFSLEKSQYAGGRAYGHTIVSSGDLCKPDAAAVIAVLQEDDQVRCRMAESDHGFIVRVTCTTLHKVERILKSGVSLSDDRSVAFERPAEPAPCTLPAKDCYTLLLCGFPCDFVDSHFEVFSKHFKNSNAEYDKNEGSAVFYFEKSAELENVIHIVHGELVRGSPLICCFACSLF